MMMLSRSRRSRLYLAAYIVYMDFVHLRSSKTGDIFACVYGTGTKLLQHVLIKDGKITYLKTCPTHSSHLRRLRFIFRTVLQDKSPVLDWPMALEACRETYPDRVLRLFIPGVSTRSQEDIGWETLWPIESEYMDSFGMSALARSYRRCCGFLSYQRLQKWGCCEFLPLVCFRGEMTSLNPFQRGWRFILNFWRRAPIAHWS